MRYFFVAISLFATLCVSGQNARTFMKAAEQFIQNGYFEDAIEQYSRALELEPQNGKAFEERAKSYEQLQNLIATAEDYKAAAVFNSNAPENFYKAAQLYFTLGEFQKSVDLTIKAVSLQQKYHNAYILQCQAYLALESYEKALEASTNALAAEKSAFAQYLKGVSEYRLNNLEQAEQDLEKAIIKDKLLFDAFLTLAELQLKNHKIKYGIENCSYVISNDPKNYKAYALQSKGYNELKQYPKAIGDISSAISLDTTNINYFILRGDYYLNFTQFQNAINDFTIALNDDMLNKEALFKRANAFEKINEKKKASSDYSLLLAIDDDSKLETISEIKNKIFELNRESVKPRITLTNPGLNDKLEVLVASDVKSVEISTLIEDDSRVKFFKINNDTLVNTPEGITKKKFDYLINTSDLEFLTISAIDIYDNASTISYAVERIETHKPRISLLNPYVGDDGIITLSTDDNFLYLEGRIEDESYISSIRIDEVTASYAPNDLNPRFTATLDIRKKNRINIRATDIYGNSIETEYLFRRDGRVLSDDSPMGKTWVVLIENSDYKDFPNLTSPEKDMQLMQQALSRYKINKVILKKNLTKREMERFFSIDLRDLVRVNQVNSLFIWFAGHGKNSNGTGYWIPSDARTDIEFTYFNINALKASLYSYSSLTHLLVVSDACQTGAAFCQALRGPIEDVSCTQTQLSVKKSAQVLTSAGSGYAYDNSLFTQSFANTLLNNDDDCVSIEDIAKRVSTVVKGNSVQQPEFGRISGIQDELGSFFFITR